MSTVDEILQGRASLPQALLTAATRRPDRGLTLLDRRGRAAESCSWAELLERARRTGARLAGLGVARGDRVLVALPTSAAWFEAWFGALFAGALPVAMAPPSGVGTAGLPRRRLEAVLATLEPRLVVCLAGLADELRASMEEVRAVTADELARAEPADLAPLGEVDPEETAFLQLTSGSTGVPRAVRIPHRAAVHNALAIDEGVGAPWGRPGRELVDCWASWLPLHHDMGLVSTLSQMITGVDAYLCPSQAFLGRPRVWLEQLAGHGVSVAVAPNFGYQLCVERLAPDALGDLDLSDWRVALCAAEMIRSDTVARFVDRFSAIGFRAEHFRPGYGLAEGTVAVTMDRRGRGARTLPMPAEHRRGQALTDVVGVGAPVMDTALRITRPDGGALPDGEIGEVRVRGPGVFTGYFRDAAATERTLVDGWLRTGDLGFLDDGELFVVGRTKDVLIIRGHNVMPHEIEWIAESASGGGGSSRAAAFGVSRGGAGEEVVLAVEVDERSSADPDALAREIRSRIGRELELPLADLVLVRRGRIPRTTSGKVRRDELRDRYLDQDLERVGG